MRAFIVLLVVAAVSAKAPLLRVGEPIPGKYIVKVKDGYDSDMVASQVDGKVGFRWKSALNGFAVELTDKALELVLALPGVEYVEQDGVMRAMKPPSWGLDRVDQRELPLDEKDYTPNTRCENGYTVWVIDTGVLDTHSDFGGRASQIISYASGGNVDCNGHGTHCAGTAAGNTFGVAPCAAINGIKVLSCSGSGATSGVISGVDYVRDNAGINDVASMSLGGGASTSLDNAVNNLVNSGVPTAVSAGNSNANACTQSPARAAQATCVGATTITDARASYSNYGSCVDIFAPGSSITSAWIGSDTATNTISGTSMSCPHVAGGIIRYEKNVNDLIGSATAGKVTNPGTGSPNLLLYV